MGSAIITYAYNFSLGAPIVRAFAYFIGWLIAVTISGAHFNPATTIAVYLVERKYGEHAKYLILAILSQICGSYLGILISHAIDHKAPLLFFPVENLIYFYDTKYDDIYFAKIILIETLMTFTFTVIFLLMKYKGTLDSTEQIIKGMALAVVLIALYGMSHGSGGCYNPAHALT